MAASVTLLQPGSDLISDPNFLILFEHAVARGSKVTSRSHRALAELTRLTPRQREIAADLGCNLGTVKGGLYSVFKKIGVASRAQLSASSWDKAPPVRGKDTRGLLLGKLAARSLASPTYSMNRLLLTLVIFCAALAASRAQFGSFGDVPIEINSEQTRFEGGIAIADRNVIIRYSDVTIYCDYATYNPDTRDVLLSGNVRLYRAGQLFTGDRALYNLETKVLNAADFRGDFAPFGFGGSTLTSQGGDAYLVKDGIFTTSDNSKPDWQLRARTVRIYAKDRIVFTNVRLYVGRTPIFWFPYLYQSLDREQSFTLVPGYSGVWGAYLLAHYTFPLAEQTSGMLRVDLLADRGVGLGFDARWPGKSGSLGHSSVFDTASDSDAAEKTKESKTGRNWGRFRSYFIDDSSPGINRTANRREPIDPARYRVSLQDRTYLTEDIYSTIDINKLSDRRFLQDFAEHEFRQNPNPDNLIAVTKWDENYTFTLLAREQLNTDQDGTERLPEAALDLKRRPVFGKSGIIYEGETSAGYFRSNFATGSLFPDYASARVDTFHQLIYPAVLGGWLSLVPRVGVRGTYYSDSGAVVDPLTGVPTARVTNEPAISQRLRTGGPVFRPVVNAGFESSFKLSRAYEDVQSRRWGLDGLRHVVQPYMNFSYVWTGKNPDEILQFDRIRRSTQLQPIDFPQFNTIDSIDNWSILRLGVRNRLQTRRDNLTFTWLEMDTYFDTNIDRPDFGLSSPVDDGTFSNLQNRLRWTPLPWVNLQVDAQLPIFDRGFTEVNTSLNFLATENMQFNVGHRYIKTGNQVFFDSNLLNIGGYFRISDNWAVSFREQYEFQTSVIEFQSYEIHRDLSSWVASLGLLVRENRGTQKSLTDVGVLLTFTLKDIPEVRLPIALDPSGTGGSSGKNR